MNGWWKHFLVCAFALLLTSCGGGGSSGAGGGGGNQLPVGPVITSQPPTGMLRNGQMFEYFLDSIGTPDAIFSVDQQSLPPWLTWSSNGVLSGRADELGIWEVTVYATDSIGNTGSQVFTITVAAGPVFLDKGATNPSGGAKWGVLFSYRPRVSGFPEPTLTIESALPAWLEFDGTTLSGVPADPSLVNVTMRASNGAPPGNELGEDPTTSDRTFTFSIGIDMSTPPSSTTPDFVNVSIGRGPESGIQGADVSPDGTVLATCGDDGAIHLWDIASRKVVAEIPTQGGVCHTLAFDPSGTKLAGQMANDTLEVWDIATESVEVSLALAFNLYPVCEWSPDGAYVVARTGNRGMVVFDTSNWLEITTIVIPTDIETCAKFLPDSTGLVVGYFTGDLLLWDTGTWTVTQIYDGPPSNDGVSGIDLSADGTVLVNCDKTNRVRVWDRASGAQIMESPSLHKSGVNSSQSDSPQSIALSPDGQTIASSWANDVVLVNTSDGTIRGRVPGHTWLICALFYSANSQELYSASGDREVRFWQK